MISVYIIKNWHDLNLFRQTPRLRGIWNNVLFHEDPLKPYDYVIIYNTVSKPVVVHCNRDNIWCVIGEPPNEHFKYLYRDAHKKYQIVFAPEKFQPALPWHINKSYDELLTMKIVKKNKKLSFVTSNKKIFGGHKKRMNFLKKLNKSGIKYDLYGKGFNEIKNKDDGLFPYKYSLAVENSQYTNYWSEKIADCFLSFTMPIYYGCSNITDYFPKESLIEIDIDDPDSMLLIKETTQSRLWEKNKEAINYARNLVLNKYQFFPYFSNFINREKSSSVDKTDIQLQPAVFSLSDKAKFLCEKIKI